MKKLIGYLRGSDDDNGDKLLAQYITDLRKGEVVEEINLEYERIGDTKEWKNLFDVLMTNNTVTCLKLKNNMIGDGGAKHLSDFLMKNNTVTSIDLSENNIGAEGMRYLADSLKINHTLVGITLGYKYIHDDIDKIMLFNKLSKNSNIFKQKQRKI